MEDAIRYLESMLPEITTFGMALSRERLGVESRTFSHRHSQSVHSLGLSCFPAGSNELDERCVALIVNVFDWDKLGVKAYVQWQATSFYTEAEPAVFDNPNAADLATFSESVRELFLPLQAAIVRGKPLGSRAEAEPAAAPDTGRELVY